MLGRYLWIVAAIALGGFACDAADAKKEAAAGDKKDAKSEKPAEPEKPAGPVDLALDKVGLKAKAPGAAEVSDGIGGGVMVMGEGLVVTVAEATDDALATPEKAKEDADMYGPQNWKSENVDGGYVATFENTGGMGTNYWVKSYRKIGDKAYLCDTTANDATQQKNAADFCKSLAKK